MTCTLPSLRLTEHHEGALSAGDCALLERHLQDCPACGELRRDLEDLVRLCRQAKGEQVRMPGEVRSRIAAMLGLAEPPAPETPRQERPPAP